MTDVNGDEWFREYSEEQQALIEDYKEYLEQYYIRYAHMDTLYVKKGQVFLEGSVIGLSGCSGNAASYKYSEKPYYHVHIEADDESTCTGIRKINVLDLIKTGINEP